MAKVTADKEGWFKLSLAGVLVSLASLFTPIFIFAADSGETYFYNICHIVNGSNGFFENMVYNYFGPVIWESNMTSIACLAILSVAALACAIIGLVTLRVQRPNTINFILTILGLIGILIPSLIVYAVVLMQKDYYLGHIYLGAAPIISPIAVFMSIGAVIRRRNKVQEMINEELQRRGLIWEAGDLE